MRCLICLLVQDDFSQSSFSKLGHELSGNDIQICNLSYFAVNPFVGRSIKVLDFSNSAQEFNDFVNGLLDPHDFDIVKRLAFVEFVQNIIGDVDNAHLFVFERCCKIEKCMDLQVLIVE